MLTSSSAYYIQSIFLVLCIESAFVLNFEFNVCLCVDTCY